MARRFLAPCLFLVLVLIQLSLVQKPVIAVGGSETDELKTYIVYMGGKPKSVLIGNRIYKRIIKSILGKKGSNALLNSYTRSFSGFSVRMTERHKNLMSKLTGIVSIFESKKRQTRTTRSWDFMGFPLTVNHSATESDIIIGVIDSGIWPESASFSDVGFGPPPAKWKGSCTANFTCNNKIVGAKYYKARGNFTATDEQSPRDTTGHGTHVASTAAGGIVTGASMLGLGLGTARGGVPAARIAVYKVCWIHCEDADILAAYDDAIADGVDIISLSLGETVAVNYCEDAIAIVSYHAMKNGILTSIAAGNEGPEYYTTSNVAPWTLGVAASITDRDYVTSVKLGNGQFIRSSYSWVWAFQGSSLNTFDTLNKMHKLIYARDAPNAAGGFNSSLSMFCVDNSLDPVLVRNKIVLCERRSSGQAAFVAGASGVLFADNFTKDQMLPSALPSSYLDFQSGVDILKYILNSSNPTATILKTVDGNVTEAPFIGSFSSRGPNKLNPDILKPDISAPGFNILAAWPTMTPLTTVVGDARTVSYNIYSGTSMACPHVTAVAAFIKSFHPTWSPAVLKSAIMTTAMPMSPETEPQAEYAYGAGHVNPIKAVNPGLVYIAGPTDYINFLCADGYTTALLRSVTGDKSQCPTTPGSIRDLNYPSFSLATKTPTSIPITTYRRTVTNVGAPSSTYKATVTAPVGLSIKVAPDILTFASVGETHSYNLTVGGWFNGTVASASLIWDDGVNQVRSPIALIWV